MIGNMHCLQKQRVVAASALALGLGAAAFAAVRAFRSAQIRRRSRLVQSTPTRDNFFMPAEWDHHNRCWLLWPYRRDNWRGKALPGQQAFANVAKAIAQFEPVTVCVPAGHYVAAAELLAHDNITVVEMSSDDSWIRDTGATFVVRDSLLSGREVRAVHWGFNGYSGLYAPFNQDELIAQKCAEIVGCSRYKVPIVLEGGSIHTDGLGTCLTTAECLLHSNRNPGYTKEQLEEILKEYMGVQKVIWLEQGLFADEDTNGHIDNICCFVKPGHVVLAWCDDENDPQYKISRDCYEVLQNSTDARGHKLKIDKLPVPAPMYRSRADMNDLDADGPRKEGERLAGSYVNFYIANGGVVVPGFGDPADAVALDVLRRCFPDREVVQVQTREVLLGGGNIHCITQQMPSGAMA